MRSIVCALAMSVLSIPGAAQGKVAVVDFNRAVLGTAEIKKAQAELEAKFRPRQEAIAKLEAELQQIQGQLQTMAGKLTPQAENDLRLQGQRKQRELERLTEDLQGDVEAERNTILQRTGRQLREVVTKLATTRDLDVVIDSSNTLFVREALDLTNEVIAAYDQAYPAK
jgi:outer membrane protein